jgi:hypothetical protein
MLYFGHILVPRQVVRELLSSLAFFVGFNLLLGSVLEGSITPGTSVGSWSGSVSGRRSTNRFPRAVVPGTGF